MFFFREPTDGQVRELLGSLGDRAFNDPCVGKSEAYFTQAPEGFVLDRYGTVLGVGDEVFRRASTGLAQMRNYPPSFTRVIRDGDELTPGLVFGTLARHFGFASLHPCRVITVFHEESPRRFGFTLGTLPGHIGSGAERFSVSVDDLDGTVRYEVAAYSRPDGWLARLARPLMRRFQYRFQRDTIGAMKSVVKGDTGRLEKTNSKWRTR